MDLVEKLKQAVRDLDSQVWWDGAYDQGTADLRELLENTVREIKDQRAWIATLTQRSRTMNTPSF
jgi:hypothetical protein